ncbi:homeodomain family transcription factor [Hanseniaspora uvarum]|nr:homeodomain family transcription factor [Hanseniaspora uvarum]
MNLNESNINLNKIVDGNDIPTPLRQDISHRIKTIEDLKFFLVTAPIKWMPNQILRKYYLNDQLGYISCIYWDNLYYITGTDITKILIFRFEMFGRKIINKKKFEEGIFSDLRSLKVDEDCILQLPKSEMLQFLNKNACIKTQKKQKVFFWFSVLHDRLFADCLERDCKREFELELLLQDLKLDQDNDDLLKKIDNIKKSITTEPVFEPAISFKYKYQDMNSEILTSKSPNSRFNRTKNKADDINNANKNKLYEQLVVYMQSLDMVKTPSINNIKFNFENDNLVENVNLKISPLTKLSPKDKQQNNDNIQVNINNTKINTEKTTGLAKKRKKLSLTIDVPDSNNIKVNHDGEKDNNYSVAEIEYNDKINTHLQQNKQNELPITDTYKDESPTNVQKKPKFNSFVPNYNNSANQEYNKFIEHMISPMGGYVNPFQMQQVNSQSTNINDKFFFNGVGFTPIRSAFPEMMTGNAYLTNAFTNINNNNPNEPNKTGQDGNPSHLNMLSNMPLFTGNMTNVQWGFMNNSDGGFSSIPPLTSANEGVKTFSSGIGKDESTKKEDRS